MKLFDALKGINDVPELNRIVGAIGALSFVMGTHAFVAWDMWRGRPFDLVGYCAAFPGGFMVIIGSIAGAVGWKDNKVAAARVTARTGAVPAPPPDGPKVPTDQQGEQ